MGFIRGGVLVIVSIFLLMSLIGVNSLFIITSSLEYENVNSQIKSVVMDETVLSEIFPGADFNLTSQEEEIFERAKEFCGNETEDYVFSYEEYEIDIPCSLVEENPEAIINKTVDGVIEGIYYGDYECDYWDCFTKEKTPLFLISEKSKNYWQEKLIFMFIFSLILVAGMFFLTENKKNFPIVLGGVLILSTLPLLKLESFVVSLAGSSLSFLSGVLTSIKPIFWTGFVLGLILIGIGVALKIWGFEGLKNLKSKKLFKK